MRLGATVTPIITDLISPVIGDVVTKGMTYSYGNSPSPGGTYTDTSPPSKLTNGNYSGAATQSVGWNNTTVGAKETITITFTFGQPQVIRRARILPKYGASSGYIANDIKILCDGVEVGYAAETPGKTPANFWLDRSFPPLMVKTLEFVADKTFGGAAAKQDWLFIDQVEAYN